MISVNVKVSPNIRKVLTNASPQRMKDLPSALESSARILQLAAKKEAPIITGTLRRSIRSEQAGKLEVAVGPDSKIAPYAVFVEFGHRTRGGSFVAPNPYMVRARTQSLPRILKIITGAVVKAIIK